ncbi:probable beta-hexosaminidase fdl [Spodoptera frugiperda]|uniref:Beta-hexosaminidase n=1 Tax=Spodoptera frugiperda TaxID=7108 RepID=A0A9R0D091_SPOFR|nr:probable beta-hexosaminidase fdl [Spodoptera frugiperda]
MWLMIQVIPDNIIHILWLLAFKIYMCQATYNTRNTLPLWNWECINDKCLPLKATHVSKLQSLETCNMLCSSIQIWPQPTGSVSLSTTAVPARSDMFQLQMIQAPTKIVHEHLQEAFAHFREDLQRIEHGSRGFEEWRSVSVRLLVNGSEDPRMTMDTDESYSLSLRPVEGTAVALIADIAAYSFCGARHGLETLLQLVWLDTYLGSLLILEAARIDDAPKFPYRGLLVDTAHNFFPISELMLNIDAMAASKLNTFHWHITDSQAFPLQTNSIPELSNYGAHTPGDVYSPDDVRQVVRRARLRGIRVLLEIDAPAHVGHAWSWGPVADLGELVFCLDLDHWSDYCTEPPCGQLNPVNERVYDLFERLFIDVLQLTGVEDMIHLGGSDISLRCWNDQFRHTLNDSMDLWVHFTRSILRRLERRTGRIPKLTIFWMSSLSERFKSDIRNYIDNIAFQVRHAAWAQTYVTGIRTIMSHEDAWDLNAGQGAWYEENNGAPYNSWQRVYEHRPWLKHGTGVIEGGEATVWSTEVGEGSLVSHTWPRAAALAERLWTDRPEGATRPVHARLDVHRTRLVQRGIPASPLWSMWCTQNTHTCN